MQYVFGPVPSRRLGRSLGIDTIPLKTCNWNCVYCQLGRTRPVQNERKPYFPKEAILAEVRQALEMHPGEIDWVTFVGSGEPTLHSELGWLIRAVQALTALPVAVITNGALLFQPPLRAELAAADAVMPSLDAGTPALYRKINRPHPGVPFEHFLEGLIAFRATYTGRLWLEVMLVAGVNDTPAALWDLAAVITRVRPDVVHVNLPTRPPAEPWVHAPDEARLAQALEILGTVAPVEHPHGGRFDLGDQVDLAQAALEIISRHPMRETELLALLRRRPEAQADAALQALHASGQAQVVERNGVRFWVGAGAYFP